MKAIVCKFGGSSVADARRIRKVAEIVRADPKRRYIVVSAPGKRDGNDQKITDLLYACHALASQGQDPSEPLSQIADRYRELARDLGLGPALDGLLQELEGRIRGRAEKDYIASRGEFLSARLLAEYLGAEFLDTWDLIHIGEDGRVEDRSYPRLAEELRGRKLVVLPGFYGSGPDGEVRTFSRGGSDITGAVVARAVEAELYENWTDVSGFLMADPKVVENPRTIPQVSYREMRELAAMGAQVLHEDSIYPVSQLGVPINIRNTNVPEDPGTMIVPSRSDEGSAVTGIAGRKGMIAVRVYKQRIHREPKLMKSLYDAIEDCRLQPALFLSGVDSALVAVADGQPRDRMDALRGSIERHVHPDGIEVTAGLALLSVVGEGLTSRPDVSFRFFSALARERIRLILVEGGSSGLSITVGLEEGGLPAAIRAVYGSFA